jgi:hypothetical protein
MPGSWGGDGTPVPPRYRGRHHRQRGRGGHRPMHRRKRGCRKTAAVAGLLAMGVLGGAVWGSWMVLAVVLGGVR